MVNTFEKACQLERPTFTASTLCKTMRDCVSKGNNLMGFGKGVTDIRTDIPSYRDAMSHLKSGNDKTILSFFFSTLRQFCSKKYLELRFSSRIPRLIGTIMFLIETVTLID